MDSKYVSLIHSLRCIRFNKIVIQLENQGFAHAYVNRSWTIYLGIVKGSYITVVPAAREVSRIYMEK